MFSKCLALPFRIGFDWRGIMRAVIVKIDEMREAEDFAEKILILIVMFLSCFVVSLFNFSNLLGVSSVIFSSKGCFVFQQRYLLFKNVLEVVDVQVTLQMRSFS